MPRYYRSARAKLIARDPGQAVVEMAFVATLLLLLMCAAIDFGRALHTMQVMTELTRQGANLALRGEGTTSCDSMCTAVASVLAGSSGLNLSSNGKVIITSLTETLTGSETVGPSGGPYKIAEQTVSSGGISETSKIGSTVGASVSLSGAPGLQTGQYLYVTEIYYSFTPLTPIAKLTGNVVAMPSVLYDIAYF
jgi:Flp pilus assembly protein TadG